MDREKVICHLNDCMEASRQDNTWVFVRKDIVEDAIAMLKEQKGLMLSLEQSNAVNGYLNAEVERLNGLLKEQEAVVRCKDCAYALFKEGAVEQGHIFCTKPFTERW